MALTSCEKVFASEKILHLSLISVQEMFSIFCDCTINIMHHFPSIFELPQVKIVPESITNTKCH